MTLRDEVEHIERYLQIMKMRFERPAALDEICTRMKSLLNVPIPRLLIQPLVENCILHGVGRQARPGQVAIGPRSGRRSRAHPHHR